MRRRANPERQIQRAVIAHLRQRGRSGLVYWHTPNGGRRNPIEAAQLKRDGTLPGVSDICAVHNRRFFALELKAPGGRPTESQLKFIDAINRAGGYAAWVEGLEAALMALEHWGLLLTDTTARQEFADRAGKGVQSVRRDDARRKNATTDAPSCGNAGWE